MTLKSRCFSPVIGLPPGGGVSPGGARRYAAPTFLIRAGAIVIAAGAIE